MLHAKICVEEMCEVSHICKTEKYYENFDSIFYKLC